MTITILDGSIGQELVHRSDVPATPYWSTSVMHQQPDLVRELHAEYFASGADIATTNTYPVLPDRLDGSGYEYQLTQLVQAAAHAAIDARDQHGSGKVAGALGPLGASYRTDFDHTVEDARALYGDVIGAMNSDVDFLIAETVSSVAQARNVIDATAFHSEKPVWIALSVTDEDGTKLRSGEDLADVVPLMDASHVEAVLINCTRPEGVKDALQIIAKAGKPFGAYANGFTDIDGAFLKDSPTVDVLSARKDLGPNEYADFAQTWVDVGATIIGGCCEVGPAHIAELARRFK